MTLTADTLTRSETRSVLADLNYLTPMAGKPRTYNYQPPAGEPERNFDSTVHRVSVADLRGREQEPLLDREGFAVLRHATAERLFLDEGAIVDGYYPESAELLRSATGASRVLIFDHTIRRRIPGQEDRRGGPRQPVARVHVDQTVKSGPERRRRHLGADAEALLRGRGQIINLWRPVRGPELDGPLA